jgi:nitrate/nitrite transporter NarK
LNGTQSSQLCICKPLDLYPHHHAEPSVSLPFGATGFFVLFFLWNFCQKRFSDSILISLDGFLVIIATILLAFADRPSRYWSFVFPAFIIGSCGNTLLFAHVSISVFQTAPASQSGVVGAILNSALQLGSAVGTAATIAIQSNVDNKQPNPITSYKGRAAGCWFLLGLVIIEMTAFWAFFRPISNLSTDEGRTEGSDPEKAVVPPSIDS